MSCLKAWPQGEIVFNNRIFSVVIAPVYGVELSNPALVKRGNTADGTPAGTQTYTGALLSGSGFSAQLFGGPPHLLSEDLRPLLPRTSFQTDSLAGFVIAPPNAVLVADVPEGMPAQIQLRAWNNRGGTVTNWLQVLADPTIARGESQPFTSPLGDVYEPPVNPIGLESFNLATGAVHSARIRINFQTNGAPVPPGYLADIGLPYGNRGNGFTYGWSADVSSRARTRNATNSPDMRYDSHLIMEGVSGPVWEIAVTNGAYRVHLAAGDPLSRDAVYRIEVENVLVVNGTPVAGNHWIEGSVVVAVSDGRLTVSSGEGCFSNRLCYVEIAAIARPELLAPSSAFSANEFHLAFRGDPAVKYQIESTSDFDEWQCTDVPGSANSNVFEFVAPADTSLGRQFYRAKVATQSPAFLFYSNGSEGPVGAEWSATNTAITPSGARQFLGRFGQTTNRLNLTMLPAHSYLKIAFDLYIIQAWDGNSVTNGPDIWELNVTDGPSLLRTTFHGYTTNAVKRQSYPGPYPGSAFPPRTGAAEINSLGYGSSGDTVYHVSYTFPHTTPSVEFNFSGRNLESITNESWGLDNVTIHCGKSPY